MTTKQLQTIEKKIIPLVTEAKSLTVSSQEDMEIATLLLSQLNKINDEIDKEKQKVLKPLNEARTAEINRWKPAIVMYDDAITNLRTKLSNYQTKVTKERELAEKAIADRVGEGKGKLHLETAVKKIEKLDKPVEKVSTQAGTLSFRTDKRLKVTSFDLIPRKYLVPDEKAILEALKGGQEVPGCEIEEIQTPINFR